MTSDPGRPRLQIVLDAIVRIVAAVFLVYALVTDRQYGQWATTLPDYGYFALAAVAIGWGPDELKVLVEKIILRMFRGKD